MSTQVEPAMRIGGVRASFTAVKGRVLRIATGEGERSLGIDREGRWAEAKAARAGTIDLTGWMALPGLVDAHAHLTAGTIGELLDPTRSRTEHVARHAAEQLAAGVTLIADKGTDHIETVAATMALDPADRPEVELAGLLLANPGGYYVGAATEIDPSEIGAAVDGYGTDDVGWVKLIGDWPRRGLGAVRNFTEEELTVAADHAHRRGMRVAIHTAAPDTPGMAVRAGIDSIEHGLFLTEDDVAMLGERGGAWVPTIAAMEDLAAALGPDSSGGRLVDEGLANVRSLLAPAVAAGVRVMAGTDLSLPHGAVVAEAERLVAHGLSEADAIEAMVGSARRFLGRPGLTVGESADLLLVDPPAGLAELGRPRLVLRGGRVVVDTR
ncbi:MAG: amidohydrolase family protein [Acidimicrobiia bacterium]